jgi:hypothetical protein
MPALIFPSRRGEGPLITVEVRPSTIYQRFNPPSAGQVSVWTAVFLLDTGSSDCLIDESIVPHLGVLPNGVAPRAVMGVGATAVPAYTVDLSLELHAGQAGSARWMHGVVQITAVASHRFKYRPFSGLVGRDILEQGRLVYDGRAGMVEVHW